MNRTQLTIIIAEGISEKVFLESLIQNQYNYVSVTGKNSICYKNDARENLLWIFPIPALGISHRGGKAILKSKDTYVRADTIIDGHTYLISGIPIINYYILRDSDSCSEESLEDREGEISSAISNAGIPYDTLEIHFPTREIEAWFLAGINDAFPYFSTNGLSKLRAVSNNLETIQNPKEFLDEILDSNFSQNNIAIASMMGSFFDIELAKTQSESFRKFFDSLNTKNLI